MLQSLKGCPMIKRQHTQEIVTVELFYVHITDRQGNVFSMSVPYDTLAEFIVLDNNLTGSTPDPMLLEAVINSRSAVDGFRINVAKVDVLHEEVE